MAQHRVVARYAVTVGIIVLCLFASVALVRPSMLSSSNDPQCGQTSPLAWLYQSEMASPPRSPSEEGTNDAAMGARKEHFTWSGGGVRGRSEAITNVLLEEWHVKIRDSLGAGLGSFDRMSEAALLSMANEFQRNATNIVLDNADCLRAMTPADLLLCHAWAASTAPEYHVGGAPRRLFHNYTLASMCAHTMACGVWARGRYSTRLNATFLNSIYQLVVADTVAASQRAPLVRNVVHRGGTGPEHRWFAERMELAAYRKQRHAAWLAEWSLTNRRDVGVALDVRPFHQGGAMWLNVTTNSTPHFVVEQTRNSGETVRTASTTFTASEALAILHHRAMSGSRSQVTVIQDDKSGGPSSCTVPTINVVVVSGDSIAFQVFRRLVGLVRDGVALPVTIDVGDEKLVTTSPARPNFGFGKWLDVVLAVYPTHDELRTFQSLMPHEVYMGKRYETEGKPTLNSIFGAEAQRRRRRFCNGSMNARAPEPEEALFYVIFLWDPLTVRPRRDALAVCGPMAVGQEALKFDQIAAPIRSAVEKGGMTLEPPVPVIPLRNLGVNIGLHAQGSSNWEARVSASFEATLTLMATGCGEHRSRHETGETNDVPLGGTALYRLTPVLSVPQSELQLFSNVATPAPRHQNVVKRSVSQKRWSRAMAIATKVFHTFFEVDRTASLFTWLNATEERERALRDTTVREPRYFSSVRILDVQKAFVMLSGNVSGESTAVFERDGLHESCSALSLWFGVTTGSASAEEVSPSQQRDDILKRIEPLQQALKSLSSLPPNSTTLPFVSAFRSVDGCGDFGTLLSITALLADIVASTVAVELNNSSLNS
ncbi:membrane-associated protein, putative [Bodo saltans]|uniref:Membrane-associated protein, putative n=1 Tax=Bodo saltans TaxID=75058 RepID=A0A0S4J8C0_BODSA|nr:membrane-associated protein, putative [Bodo saltans]|eukprot:CUG87677.1 membrane-associated protein, putative [Bodo saltans]